MSTFTNILQQKINNLEAQIRQLQEQNAHLRNKARWLMEAAASADMSMLQPTVQNDPMGQYTGANPDSTYTNYATTNIATPQSKTRGWTSEAQNWANSPNRKDGDVLDQGNGIRYIYHAGPPITVDIIYYNPETFKPIASEWWKYDEKTGTWKLFG